MTPNAAGDGPARPARHAARRGRRTPARLTSAPAGAPAGADVSTSPATDATATATATATTDSPAGAARGGGASVLSSSAVMAAGTFLSRILGFVRVIALAWAIGQVGASADGFATANTLPNSLFTLIGGGVLNAVLVPQIVRAAKRPDGGRDYTDRLLTLAITVLGGATVVSTALAPLLVQLFGGSGYDGRELEVATDFALWCLPQIFFYGLYTVYGQVLNARGSFGPYMWAPVVNNVVAIAGCLVFVAVHGRGVKEIDWWTGQSTALLAGTATLGVAAQALVLVPALSRAGYRWRPRFGFRGMGLSTAGRVAGWTFAGVAAGQLGFVVISRAANSVGGDGTAAGRAMYDNAYLFFMLPHSLIAVSVVTSVFTRMSAAAGAGRPDEVRDDLSLAMRLTGLANVVSTVAFPVLGPDLMATVFGGDRGVTDDLALVCTAMGLGLVAFSAQYLFARVFYAYEDARTPFVVQVVTIVVWASGSALSAAVLPDDRVVFGIGLAMSASNVVAALLALVLLRRLVGGADGRRVLLAHLRFLAAAAVAGVASRLVVGLVHGVAGTGWGGSVVSLAAGATVLLGGYGVLLHLLRAPELAALLRPVTARLRRA